MFYKLGLLAGRRYQLIVTGSSRASVNKMINNWMFIDE